MRSSKKILIIISIIMITGCSPQLVSKGTETLCAGMYNYENRFIPRHDEQYPDSFFDLDIGEIGNIEEADIWFGGENNFYGIDNENNTVSQEIGYKEPGYEVCQKKLPLLTEGGLAPTGHQIGIYSCFKTSQNNISQILVTDHTIRDHRICITLEYITWTDTK